jgi:hypothetical protein
LISSYSGLSNIPKHHYLFSNDLILVDVAKWYLSINHLSLESPILLASSQLYVSMTYLLLN